MSELLKTFRFGVDVFDLKLWRLLALPGVGFTGGELTLILVLLLGVLCLKYPEHDSTGTEGFCLMISWFWVFKLLATTSRTSCLGLLPSMMCQSKRPGNGLSCSKSKFHFDLLVSWILWICSCKNFLVSVGFGLPNRHLFTLLRLSGFSESLRVAVGLPIIKSFLNVLRYNLKNL